MKSLTPNDSQSTRLHNIQIEKDRKGDAVGDRATETETGRREAHTQAPKDIHYYEENP